jgi:hypothetical protein
MHQQYKTTDAGLAPLRGGRSDVLPYAWQPLGGFVWVKGWLNYANPASSDNWNLIPRFAPVCYGLIVENQRDGIVRRMYGINDRVERVPRSGVLDEQL